MRSNTHACCPSWSKYSCHASAGPTKQASGMHRAEHVIQHFSTKVAVNVKGQKAIKQSRSHVRFTKIQGCQGLEFSLFLCSMPVGPFSVHATRFALSEGCTASTGPSSRIHCRLFCSADDAKRTVRARIPSCNGAHMAMLQNATPNWLKSCFLHHALWCRVSSTCE